MQTRESILSELKAIKPAYETDGFRILGIFGSASRGEITSLSDIDILYDVDSKFCEKYGFGSISKINEIKGEISKKLGMRVDLASPSGMGKVAYKYIVQQALYI